VTASDRGCPSRVVQPWCRVLVTRSVWAMPGREELQDLHDTIQRLRQVLAEIHAWPSDDAEYRGLLLELRELQRVLDEKLPPATETLT
jgi:hypothetical protein